MAAGGVRIQILCLLGFGSLELSKLYFLFCKNGILISRAHNAELRIKWASTRKSALQMLVIRAASAPSQS